MTTQPLHPTVGPEIMRTLRSSTGLLAILLASACTAAAQSVDRTVATSGTGRVEIHNVAGEVRVVGWDRNEVRVTGTLGEGTERLDVNSSGDNVVVRVVIPERARNVRPSDIEVRVPVRKDVTARGVSANVQVSGVQGAVDAASVSGQVTVSGQPREVRATSTSGGVRVDAATGRVEATSTSGQVEVAGTVRGNLAAETVSGDLHLRAPAAEVAAKSVSGSIEVSGATRRLTATTVSGRVDVRGSRLQSATLESVSGPLSYAGEVEGDGTLSFVSHSGDVRVSLPRATGARFQAATFSGEINSDFGGNEVRSGGGPGRQLSFTSGNGGALITVKSFSGGVRLLAR